MENPRTESTKPKLHHFSKRRFVLLALIALFAFAAGMAVMWALSTVELKKATNEAVPTVVPSITVEASVEPTLVDDVTNTVTPTADPTADWKEYNYKNFSFKYPNNWSFNIEDTGYCTIYKQTNSSVTDQGSCKLITISDGAKQTMFISLFGQNTPNYEFIRLSGEMLNTEIFNETRTIEVYGQCNGPEETDASTTCGLNYAIYDIDLSETDLFTVTLANDTSPGTIQDFELLQQIAGTMELTN